MRELETPVRAAVRTGPLGKAGETVPVGAGELGEDWGDFLGSREGRRPMPLTGSRASVSSPQATAKPSRREGRNFLWHREGCGLRRLHMSTHKTPTVSNRQHKTQDGTSGVRNF